MMKYCKNCGSQIDENAIFCPRCGSRVNGDSNNMSFNPYGGYGVIDNEPSKLLTVLSFIFWWVGLAVWLFCRRTRPGKARSALMGLLGSACFGIPLVGAVIWTLWRDDPEKKDYARMAGKTAIAGAIFYGIWALASAVAVITGAMDVGYFMDISEALSSVASIG